ncbi:hypothetical protein CDAR_17391 [Caerostris darwini]|uniref:Uncharacterized protein n=1 Tax=Caerostris darwini TaxID=1538125 RepID=A0AAV4VFA8_9ARAC|nr:hypothetical protein CDAR_17391 [Caerostris darwini]
MFIKIASLIIVINILDFIIFDFIQERNSNLTKCNTTHIIIINCGILNIEQMLVIPTVQQYQLQYPILKPAVKLQYHTNLSMQLDDTAEITIELRKPTIDQLLCYPTVEQYQLNDTIL